MRIAYPAVFALLALAISACTIKPQGTELTSELHPPLTYTQWESESYTTQDGKSVCSICSGYNGLSVLSWRKSDGGLGISVKSNRSLPVGGDFSINVNRNRYITVQEFFSASESVQIVQDLSSDGKAYLEWSEVRHHKGKRRLNNIIKLEGFAVELEECKRSLLGTSKPL